MVARPRLVRALAFSLLLGACGASTSQQRVNGVQGTKSNSSIVRTPATVGAAATSAPTPAGAQPANVSPTLQFTAARLDGGTVDGTAYAGKPVAFWFWAPG